MFLHQGDRFSRSRSRSRSRLPIPSTYLPPFISIVPAPPHDDLLEPPLPLTSHLVVVVVDAIGGGGGGPAQNHPKLLERLQCAKQGDRLRVSGQELGGLFGSVGGDRSPVAVVVAAVTVDVEREV